MIRTQRCCVVGEEEAKGGAHLQGGVGEVVAMELSMGVVVLVLVTALGVGVGLGVGLTLRTLRTLPSPAATPRQHSTACAAV
jgi:hypothetical protein